MDYKYATGMQEIVDFAIRQALMELASLGLSSQPDRWWRGKARLLYPWEGEDP